VSDAPESLHKDSENVSSPSTSSDQAKSGWPATVKLLGRVGGIGWFVGTAIALGAYGGYWLDRQFDTAPVLTILGLALGVLTAFVGMIRLLSAIRRGR
jgi:F0F1-type ATP synthase assembly protein I